MSKAVGREFKLRNEIEQTAREWVDHWDDASSQGSSEYTARLFHSLDELRRFRTNTTHASDIPMSSVPRHDPQPSHQPPPRPFSGRDSLPSRRPQAPDAGTNGYAGLSKSYSGPPRSSSWARERASSSTREPFDRFSMGPKVVSNNARVTHGSDDFLRPSSLMVTPKVGEPSQGLGRNPRTDLEKRKFRLRSIRQMFEDELENDPLGDSPTTPSQSASSPSQNRGTPGKEDGDSSTHSTSHSSANTRDAKTADGTSVEAEDNDDTGLSLDDLLVGGNPHSDVSGRHGRDAALSFGVANGLLRSSEVPAEHFHRTTVLNIRKEVREYTLPLHNTTKFTRTCGMFSRAGTETGQGRD